MTAEFQVPSPLVPTRESYFVRYCKQHTDGTWAVVDVSLDNLRPSPSSRCRRRPSGCLIHEMPNGYSKVIINPILNCKKICCEKISTIF
jgi:homeobox-leucine zipper protein